MDLIEEDFGEKLKALKFSNWETLESWKQYPTNTLNPCIIAYHFAIILRISFIGRFPSPCKWQYFWFNRKSFKEIL